MTPEDLEAARQEFEWSFGDVVRALDEDEDTVFYTYFLGEFLKGVEYGIANPGTSAEALQVEAALRYVLQPEEDFAKLEPESQSITGKGSGLVFLYGAHWAESLLESRRQH